MTTKVWVSTKKLKRCPIPLRAVGDGHNRIIAWCGVGETKSKSDRSFNHPDKVWAWLRKQGYERAIP